MRYRDMIFLHFAIKWHDKQNIFWTQFCPLVKLTLWRPLSSMFFELTDRNSTDPVHYTDTQSVQIEFNSRSRFGRDVKSRSALMYHSC